MEDDQGTEDLFGEDWRSKVQAKGGRQYEDPLAVSLERSRERGRGREATAPGRFRRLAGATYSGAC